MAQSAYDFVDSIGVNTHLNYFDTTYGNFTLVKNSLQSLGIRHVRDGVHLQNSDYNQAVYSRWAQLGAVGIRFDATVDPRSNLGTITTSLLNQVQTLANNTIELYEGANEMDISGQAGWAAVDTSFQQGLYNSVEAMKGSNPPLVVGPSLAFASNGSKLGNLSSYLYYGNLHPYPAGQTPSVIFPQQTQLAGAVCGAKPIMVTETGYHNALNDHSDQPGISETAAAKYIPRLYLQNFSRGIIRTYLYELLDESPDPRLTNEQQHWGLVRADGSQKPAFTALKNLIADVNGSSEPEHLETLAWQLSSTPSTVQHVLLQDASYNFYLILWNGVSSYDTKAQQDITNAAISDTLTLGKKATSISVYEPTVQAQPTHVYTNTATATLQIPDDPLVVKISF